MGYPPYFEIMIRFVFAVLADKGRERVFQEIDDFVDVTIRFSCGVLFFQPFGDECISKIVKRIVKICIFLEHTTQPPSAKSQIRHNLLRQYLNYCSTAGRKMQELDGKKFRSVLQKGRVGQNRSHKSCPRREGRRRKEKALPVGSTKDKNTPGRTAADLMLVLPSAPSRLIADHYGRYGFCK